MRYAKLLGASWIAVGLGLISQNNSAGAAQCQFEAWAFYNEAGTNVGDLCPEGSDNTQTIYSVEKLQIRFYVEHAEDADGISKGYFVVYDTSFPPCAEGTAQDHFGQQIATWGYLERRQDPNSENFAMRLSKCSGPFVEVYKAVYD